MRGELGPITILLRRCYGRVNFKVNTGYTFERILRLKSDLPMSRFVACQLAHDHWFSTESAKSDFGYEPIISMSEAMKKTLPWLRSL